MKKLLTTLLVLISSINLYSQTELDSLVLVKINQYRVSLGLNKLEFSKETFLAAQHHTKYMINVGEIGHKENSETPNTYHRLLKYGVDNFTLVGENCTTIHMNGQTILEMSESIFNNWKESPSHNRIIN